MCEIPTDCMYIEIDIRIQLRYLNTYKTAKKGHSYNFFFVLKESFFMKNAISVKVYQVSCYFKIFVLISNTVNIDLSHINKSTRKSSVIFESIKRSHEWKV